MTQYFPSHVLVPCNLYIVFFNVRKVTITNLYFYILYTLSILKTFLMNSFLQPLSVGILSGACHSFLPSVGTAHVCGLSLLYIFPYLSLTQSLVSLAVVYSPPSFMMRHSWKECVCSGSSSSGNQRVARGIFFLCKRLYYNCFWRRCIAVSLSSTLSNCL